MSASSSKWMPAPVALFTDQQRAVRTLPWCLEIGHAPLHPMARQLTTAAASASSLGACESPKQPDALADAAIHPDVRAMETELVADRRWLHTNAELSFEEDATHAYIADKLRALGLEPLMGLGRAPVEFEGAGGNYHRREVGTGITADILGGAGDGPCIALRADIDALPIVETDDSAAGLGGYKSANVGCMHACGHDAHTAMLLATAAVLVKSRARLKGKVRLIFQPAEEFGAGAKYMVSDGVLEGVDQIYGVHVMNFLETGTIGVKSGPLSEHWDEQCCFACCSLACATEQLKIVRIAVAAPDKFSITVQGKGGHGGMPHETVDALLVASMVVTSLQSVVARYLTH
jgi:amidohydrolase